MKQQTFLRLVRVGAVVLTAAVFEWFGAMLGAGGAPLEGLDMLASDLRARLMDNLLGSMPSPTSAHEQQAARLKQALVLEKAFFDAGGTLMVGTDPTGGGQAVPGFAGLRSMQLMTKAVEPLRGKVGLR